MTLDDFQEFCLSFNGVSKDFPFDDETTLAFQVMDKIFAITNIDTYEGINLKCDPIKAAMLRDLYEEVQPGQHMDKKNWNTIIPEGKLDDELIEEWIKDSYNLVVEDLSRKKQKKLEKMEEDD
ncbi:putative DNA-binding protein, MmcQ/YjbR family [Fodinibius salinus]|uniref:Putative DNA-binding protein, MmcQ/YjbR family n=1 Tax=Fodinibius salinus TaxID=860790 RepID=A0A5D3YKX6_9BACT|nr:MmcQ/YjbR family DNA-binding protein [Fodinibius salinus]TYP93307.1 putative DNA-binding protein, MmcQ/YjbR family [Fodinibius salinus]